MTDQISQLETDVQGLDADETARDAADAQAFADLEAAVAGLGLSAEDQARIDEAVAGVRARVEAGTVAATAADPGQVSSGTAAANPSPGAPVITVDATGKPLPGAPDATPTA